ncbi:TIGR00266 family protein [Methylomonas sp. LL1]|uniref:TIGR00266 family protein n=1 Tax=Methylomonas sp. LL1 TaxID=2785785 RepID=UPI0018C38832|nr:TIGR00266 family protein [Methylomonas sp. LL1]QPK63415.1 TIGR00266 family protein [Methylomonas sp. LL1]
MRCHQVDYQIIGHDIQMVEIELDPGETVIAEAGAMTYIEQDIDFEAKMGDGSGGVMDKLFGIGKRMLTGESVFLTHFSNTGKQKRRAAFSAPFPGSVIPLNLAELGEEVICQRTAFLAAAFGTQVDIAFNKRLGSGFFGGEGFILQRLRGDGMAFIHAGGTVVRKELRNETLRLDTGCLVAFSGDIDYDIGISGGLTSMLFGGEGIFLATLKGTGSVWIQSMPFSRLAERVLSHYQPPLQDKG